MGWEELLLADMGRFVSRQIGKPVKALYFDYDDGSPGGCDTCGPDSAEVIIAYQAVADETKYYFYYGSLGNLLDELRK